MSRRMTGSELESERDAFVHRASAVGTRSAWVDDVGAAVESGEEFGLGVYSMVLVLPPSSSTTVEMRFSGRMTLDDTYNLDVHAQPTANPDILLWRLRRADAR